MKNKKVNEEIDKLILSGALEVCGIDADTGEFMFKFTDKLEQHNKELYDVHMQQVYDEIMYFWEKGFINIDDFFSKNPIIELTDKCFDKSAVAELPKAMRFRLQTMIDALNN